MKSRSSRFWPILPGLGRGRMGCRAGLGGVGPVLAVRGVPVAAYLPADRRRAAAQLGRDGPDSGLLPQPVGDVDAVGLAQVAREGRSRLNARRHHRVDRWCRLVPARGSAYVPPSLAGPDVDADDRGGLGVAHSLIHKPEVCLPLLDQLPGSLRPPVLPDLEVHCHPWTGVLQRPLEPGQCAGPSTVSTLRQTEGLTNSRRSALRLTSGLSIDSVGANGAAR